MSFWVGLVVLVLVLEAVRIGLSTFLLLHILRGIESAERRVGDGPSLAEPPAPAGWAHERDRLASEAMIAVRQAMDERGARDADRAVTSAISALDAYVLHHQEERAA